jgi:hypothetical protein
MLGRQADERVLGVHGGEASGGGDEGEEEVLCDEAPGEDADDRTDLVTQDRAESDADCAPERCRGERSEQQQRDRAAAECERDAAAERVASPMAKPSPSPRIPKPSPASRPAASLAASTRERLGVTRKVGRIVP